MALAVNSSPYSVALQKLPDGMYIYGTKKIQVRMMSEKVIVRIGGQQMLIEEFIKNYAKTEMDL